MTESFAGRSFLLVCVEIDPRAGGMERYLNNIVQFLVRKGAEVRIVALQPRRIEYWSPAGRRTWRFPRLPRQVLGWAIARWARRCDVLLNGHLFFSPLMADVARRLDRPWLLFVYGIDCWTGRFAEREASFERLAGVLSISTFSSRQVVAQGWPAERIALIPPVLDDDFMARARRLAGERRPWDGTGPFSLLTIGRLASSEGYKGHDVVIPALARARATGANVRYTVVGRGDDMDRLQGLARQAGIAEYVDFAGFVDDAGLDKRIAEAGCFIMPSRVSLDPAKPEGEGFGIVFIEAGASGVPCIGPDDGGSLDIIADGETGLAVPPADVEAVTGAILRYYADPGLAAMHGAALQALVEARFTEASLSGYLHDSLALLRHDAATGVRLGASA